MSTTETIKKLPLIDQNYASFTKALSYNGWRCNWRLKGGEHDQWDYIENWMSPQGELIITQRWRGTGWDYYRQSTHHKILDCIKDLALKAVPVA